MTSSAPGVGEQRINCDSTLSRKCLGGTGDAGKQHEETCLFSLYVFHGIAT